MAIITSTEVFDFMGTDSDVRTKQGPVLIDPLISNVQIEIEDAIGRKVEKEIVSGDKFENAFNCVILGDQLFLKGKYRDLYIISELKEDGVVLTPEVDYLFDPRIGSIKRFNQQWSQEKLAIEITGELGLVEINELAFGPLIPISTSGESVMSILTTSSFYLLASGAGSGDEILRSIDRGKTWTAIPSIFGNDDPSDIASIGDVVVVVGDNGLISRSSDGGQTLSAAVSNPFGTDQITTIESISNIFIAGAANGKISRSTDLGVTWSSLITNPFGTSRILDITASASRLIASTDDGKIAYSDDFGLTWSGLVSNAFGGDSINSIVSVGSVVIIVGDTGKISRSVDNGTTFSFLLPNPFNFNIMDVATDGNTVMAVGFNGEIGTSSDLGITWSLLESPFGGFFADSNLFAVAQEGSQFIAGGELGKLSQTNKTSDTNKTIKQVAIEMVAAKSGLWKRVVLTEGGELDTTIMSAPKTTMASLMQFKLREI